MILICASKNALFCQIEDGNFEKWDSVWHLQIDNLFELVPSDWNTNNEIHPEWNPFLFSTPVIRSEDSYLEEYSALVESKAKSIDAWYSGILYQDIPLKNLNQLEFWIKCDSLSGNSGCFIEVFGINDFNENQIIYQDSIKQETLDFEKYTVKVDDFVSVAYDSIRLQFRAKGAGGFKDASLLGHTIMLVDGVKSNYLSSTNDFDNHLLICPNPIGEEMTIQSKFENITSVEMYSITGIKILNKISTSTLLNINTSILSKGVYILKINFSNHFIIEKVYK